MLHGVRCLLRVAFGLMRRGICVLHGTRTYARCCELCRVLQSFHIARFKEVLQVAHSMRLRSAHGTKKSCVGTRRKQRPALNTMASHKMST